MGVVVHRGLGDIPGESIVSEILTTESLQRECGEQHLNDNSTNVIEQSGNIIGMIECDPGDICQVNHKGDTNYGYVDNVSIMINMEGGYSVNTSISSELIDD